MMVGTRKLKEQIAEAQGAFQTKLVELYIKVKSPTLTEEERVKIRKAIADIKAHIGEHAAKLCEAAGIDQRPEGNAAHP